jgi:hypothetical protein
VLVQTRSLYAALYDAASPVNVSGFMDKLFTRAKWKSLLRWWNFGQRLFIFNGLLMDRAKAGEMLAWTLLFDGVFDCQLQLVDAFPEPVSHADSIGGDVMTTLNVPSGQLVVSCLGEMGEAHRPILQVAPGCYEVVLIRNGEAEAQHEFLENPQNYVPGDRPDWVVYLRKV